MRVVIAVHSYSYGTAQAFRDYLETQGHEVLFLETPLHGSYYDWFWGFMGIIQKVMLNGGYDLFLGADCLNCFAGLILKKLGYVGKVIYFFLDYTEKRFENGFLNNLYWFLDYFCIRHSDRVWNSSNPIDDLHAKMHIKRGVPLKYLPKQFAIPEGTVDFPFQETYKKRIIWVGHLKKGMGVELLIGAFSEINNQDWKLYIMGKGALYEKLSTTINNNNIRIINEDIPRGYSFLLDCAIGVAPYEPQTISQHTDPGKVKNYLSCSLAVILTKVPLIWKEIEETQSGIAIDYDKEQLKDALKKMMFDEEFLKKCRGNSYKLSKKYKWEDIFEGALCGLW